MAELPDLAYVLYADLHFNLRGLFWVALLLLYVSYGYYG
jgi:hypothetical protein